MARSRRASREQDPCRSASMTTETAREWGHRLARESPHWSEEKWQRVATLLGIRFTNIGKATDDVEELES